MGLIITNLDIPQRTEYKTGEWVKAPFGYGRCSECGCSIGNHYSANYCPKCGAKMVDCKNGTQKKGSRQTQT